MVTQFVEAGQTASLMLHVRGPARLTIDGEILKLRRKGLAILYYLAFEGATRRERLADLLWDGQDPLANLRVELNSISSGLKSVGIAPLPRHMDPLMPPHSVQLELGTSAGDQNLLDGLDGLGAEYQEWLDWRRSRLQDSAVPAGGFDVLLDSLAGSIRAPFLIVAEPQPVYDARGFVAALSARLHLPIVPAFSAGAGIRHVSSPYPAQMVAEILKSEKGVWVVERPFFGRDPQEILELRSQYPAQAMRYVRLPPLSWFTVRSSELGKLPFVAAANEFIAASGHPGLLREAADLTEGQPTQLPQRFRAATELELRKLTDAARQALQRLSVHTGILNPASLQNSVTDEILDELAEQRWLEFESDGWRFVSSFVREAVYRSLPTANRMASHRRLAADLLESGEHTAARIQLLLAGEPLETSDLARFLDPWARGAFGQGFEPGPAATVPVRTSRQDSFMEVIHSYGHGLESSGTHMAIARHCLAGSVTGVALALPEGRKVVNVSGRALVVNVFGVGHHGNSVPLRIRCQAGREVILAPGLDSGEAEGNLLLPLGNEFNYWLVCTGRELTIESSCEKGVIEFDTRCFMEQPGGVERQAWLLTA